MDINNIPESRKVVFMLGKTNLFEELKKNTPKLKKVPDLIYTDETTIQVSSQYGNLINIKGSNLLTLLSGATNGVIPSAQFGLQGLQVWESTEPLEFSLSVELHMKNSGTDDVLIPALALSKVALPSYKGGDSKKGMMLIPPGPDLKDVLSLVGASIGVDALFSGGREKKEAKDGGGMLSVKIGKFITIPNVLITKAEPTFSKLLDEDGAPVSCKIQLSFKTMEVATTYMIEQLINSFTPMPVSSSAGSSTTPPPVEQSTGGGSGAQR